MTIEGPDDARAASLPSGTSSAADASPAPEPARETIVRSPVSFWFLVAGGFGALFCMTAIAWAAAGVGDQRHPLKAWLGRHGVTLIAVESLVVLGATVLGMVIPEPTAQSAISPHDDRG